VGGGVKKIGHNPKATKLRKMKPSSAKMTPYISSNKYG